MRFSLEESVDHASHLRRRHVRRSAMPKQRMMQLRTFALQMRSLFTRKRSSLRLGERLMVGSGPIADSAHMLEVLASPRLKVKEILEMMHGSAATACEGTSFGKERREVFLSCAKEHLKRLDDVALYRMHRKMNSRRMRDLRESLQKASRKEGREGARGRVVGEEFTQMSDTLEMMEKSLAHELRRRGFSGKGGALGQMEGRKDQAKAIDLFAEDMKRDLLAGGGRLPTEIRTRFDSVLEDVNEDFCYAGAFCERLDPMSGRLSVTDDFLHDYGAQEMSFEDSEGVPLQQEIAEGGAINLNSEEERLSLSQGLLDFCEGREEQALRLSQLMTKETARVAWTALIDFREGGNPYLDLPNKEPGRLYSRSGRKPRLLARRMKNGDIALEVRRSQDLQGFHNLGTDRFQFFAGEKSALDCYIGFHVPADSDKPVRLDENSRYSYHLREKPATLFSELPAHWANAV